MVPTAKRAEDGQAGGEALAIIEESEDLHRLPVKVEAGNQVGAQHIGHGQEVETAGLARLVVQTVEDGEGLLVIAHCLHRLLDVHVPVGDVVQAVRQGARVVYAPSQSEGAFVVATRARVVALSPEEAQIDQGLPLTLGIVGVTGYSEACLEIGQRPLELAQESVRVATLTVEARR